MFKFAREIITCMISRDDLGLVPWKSTRRSMEFNFFFTDSGRTLYGITRHNNRKTIPIIFRADSAGMSNSEISLAEYQGESKDLATLTDTTIKLNRHGGRKGRKKKLDNRM